MSNQFDWRTEEDGEWESLSLPQKSVTSLFTRLSLPILLSFVLLVGFGLLLYRQVQRQVDAATTAVSADIRSSYRLLYRAVSDQDLELFNTVISGRSPQWTQTQQMLLKEGFLFDRRPLGLHYETADPAHIEVFPSDDLTAAEVTVIHQYNVPLADGEGEVVALQQTAVFRRGRQRWLVSPPSADFWGTWQMVEGRYFQFTFPERDAELARRMLPDLETNVSLACHQGVLDCTQLPDVLFRFDTDPASLMEISNSAMMPDSSGLFNVPAPSLVGVPVDEVGYQWLRHGYAAQLIAVMITRQVGWECCGKGLFFQAMLDEQLSRLGLRTWPLTPAVYGQILQQQVAGVHRLDDFWETPPVRTAAGPAWPQVYALVDYILDKDKAVTPLAMMSRLSMQDSYIDWLRGFMPVNGDGFIREQRNWLRFVQEHTDQERPLSLPRQQDIQLMCKPSFNGNSYLYRYHLYRYEPDEVAWRLELEDRRFLFMASLPQDEGILLQERRVRLDQTRLLIWQGEEEVSVLSEPFSSGLFRIDPVVNGLLLYGYHFGSQQISFSLLDVSSCAAAGCDLFALNGLPVWSPNGRFTIINDPSGLLWLGDGQGQVETAVGAGTAPFWLDDNKFGYVRLAGTLDVPPAEIVITTLSAPHENEVLLPLSALTSLLPADVSLRDLAIRDIATHPAQPGKLFIAVAFRQRVEQEGGFIFHYDVASNELTMPLAIPYDFGPYNPLTFSPNGRWLTVQSFARSGSDWDLHLLNGETGRIVSYRSNYPFLFPGYDWSADGQWLLRVENGFIQLIAPDEDYQEILVHDHASCNFAAWINPQ